MCSKTPHKINCIIIVHIPIVYKFLLATSFKERNIVSNFIIYYSELYDIDLILINILLKKLLFCKIFMDKKSSNMFEEKSV